MNYRFLSTDWGRINLIYSLRKLEVPGQVWLPVNRNYMPIGYPYDGYGAPAPKDMDYLHQAMQFAADPMQFKGVWWQDDRAPFLYNDGDESRVDYFERLQKLLRHSVKVPLSKHPQRMGCYLPRPVVRVTG